MQDSDRSIDETQKLQRNEEINYSKADILPQVAAASAASLGSVAMGLSLGWSSPVQLQLVFNSSDLQGTEYLILDAEEWTWVASLLTLGALLGGLLSGLIIDPIGRKGGLLLATLPYMIGWILITIAGSPIMLYSGRIFTGIAGGICSVATPTYIVEISTPNVRGTLGILYHLAIVTGIWICSAVGLQLDDRLTEDWRWISAVCASAPLFLAVSMIFVPETPYWLLSKGHRKEAAKSLRRIRGPLYDIQRELAQLESGIRTQNSTNRLSDLFGWWALKPFLVALGIVLFHQMSGINAILFYMAAIFEDAGSDLPPLMSSFICNAVRVLVTVVVVALVDKTGRKCLMLASTIFSAVGMLALGTYYYIEEYDREIAQSISWLPIVSMTVFLAGFAVGLGPLPWLITAEILPRKVKGPANSIVSFFNWSLSFTATKTFVDMQQSLSNSTMFWLFGGICLAGVLFTVIVLPETKGKTYDEIQAFFGNGESTVILHDDDDEKPMDR